MSDAGGLIAEIGTAVRIARAASTLDEVVARLATQFQERFKLWRATAGLARGESYDIRAVWSPVGTIFEPGDVITVDPSEESRLLLDVLFRGRVTAGATRALVNGVLRDAVLAEGIEAFIVLPIRDPADDVVGALTFDSADPLAFDGAIDLFDILRNAIEPEVRRLMLGARGR